MVGILSEPQNLKTIHYMFRYFLDKHNYYFIGQIMYQFNERSDANELKTILLITKPYKDYDEIRDSRYRIQYLYDQKNRSLI